MINRVIFVNIQFKIFNNKILLKVLAKEENKTDIYIFLKLDSKPTICRKYGPIGPKFTSKKILAAQLAARGHS